MLDKFGLFCDNIGLRETWRATFPLDSGHSLRTSASSRAFVLIIKIRSEGRSKVPPHLGPCLPSVPIPPSRAPVGIACLRLTLPSTGPSPSRAEGPTIFGVVWGAGGIVGPCGLRFTGQPSSRGWCAGTTMHCGQPSRLRRKKKNQKKNNHKKCCRCSVLGGVAQTWHKGRPVWHEGAPPIRPASSCKFGK